MKIWLDDIRKPPDGWIHIMSVEELIPFFEDNFDKIEAMSLDHDLGLKLKTGDDFLLWLEKAVCLGRYKGIPIIEIHTANPVGERRMKQALKNIEGRILGCKSVHGPLDDDDEKNFKKNKYK